MNFVNPSLEERKILRARSYRRAGNPALGLNYLNVQIEVVSIVCVGSLTLSRRHSRAWPTGFYSPECVEEEKELSEFHIQDPA